MLYRIYLKDGATIDASIDELNMFRKLHGNEIEYVAQIKSVNFYYGG